MTLSSGLVLKLHAVSLYVNIEKPLFQDPVAGLGHFYRPVRAEALPPLLESVIPAGQKCRGRPALACRRAQRPSGAWLGSRELCFPEEHICAKSTCI